MKQILIFLFAAALLLCGCRRNAPPEVLSKKTSAPAESFESTLSTSSEPNLPASSNELLYLTDTLAEANKIADLYDIELIRHYDGLAVFHTDEDPREVIRRGIENGWPELSLNHTVNLY